MCVGGGQGGEGAQTMGMGKRGEETRERGAGRSPRGGTPHSLILEASEYRRVRVGRAPQLPATPRLVVRPPEKVICAERRKCGGRCVLEAERREGERLEGPRGESRRLREGREATSGWGGWENGDCSGFWTSTGS